MKRLSLLIGYILILVSCNPDNEEYRLYSAHTNNGLSMYSDEAIANVQSQRVSGKMKYFYTIDPNSAKSGVYMDVSTFSDTQRHFTLPELKANYTDVLGGHPEAIKATMDITDISDGVISGTFSGVFVRNWIRYSDHVFNVTDTIRVTDGEFRITYFD